MHNWRDISASFWNAAAILHINKWWTISEELPLTDNLKSSSSQIIKNVLMNWAAFAATILTGFFMSPFLIRHLGDSVYGVWILVGSLVGYLGLLDFGITPSTVKYVAEHRARGDQEGINRVVSVGFAVFASIGLAVFVVSCVMAFSFNAVFRSPLSNTTAAAVVMLAGLNLAISFPASVFLGLLRGYQRYDIDAATTTLMIIARTAAIIALVGRGYGILALSVVAFSFDLLRFAYVLWWAYRLNPGICIARRYLDRNEMQRMFSYSAFYFLIIVGRRLLFFTDEIVVGLFISTAAVTAYFIANRLVSYLRQLIVEMLGVLTPTTSDLDARNDKEGIKRLLIISTKYMLLIALPVGEVFFLMGDNFIGLWMGQAYSGSARILAILTVATLTHLMEMPAHTILLGLGKHKVVAKFFLAQAAVNLALSVLLVRSLGTIGVALGTAIPMSAFTLIATVTYFRRYIKIPLSGYLRRAAIWPLLVQAPFIISLLLLKVYAPPQTLLLFFLEIAAALVPYGGLALLVCTSPSERRAFLRVAERHGLKPVPRFS
jgi:O-antigen/teichoic acid export membrane protein